MLDNLKPTQVTTGGAAKEQLQNQVAKEEAMKFTMKEEDIHVMPQQYLPDSSGKGKEEKPASNKTFVIIIIVVFLVLAAAVGGLYIFTTILAPTEEISINAPVKPVDELPGTNVNQPVNTNQPNVNAEPLDLTTVAGRDLQRVRDLSSIEVALDFYFRDNGFYPQVLSGIPQNYLPEEPRDPLTNQRYSYTNASQTQSFGVRFTIEKQALYNDKVLTTGIYELKPNGIVEPANLNPTDNLPPDDTSTTTPPEIPGQPQAYEDRDGDGLTTVEEVTFQTFADNPDSDGDGYSDGDEVLNLYSPTLSDRAQLNDSGLVQNYRNDSLGYSIWYGRDWVYRSIDVARQEVIFSASSGDTVTVNASTNAELQGIEEWYLANFAGANQQNLQIIELAGQKAIASQDGLAVYVSNGPTIFVITYTPGSTGQVNYPTLFQMMLKTLIFD